MELRRGGATTSQALGFHRQLSKPTEATGQGMTEAALRTNQGRIQNLDVQVAVRNRAAGTIQCLEGEIQQVLNNLIGNAIDAMKPHGGKLLLRSANTHDWKTERPCIRITVADSGTGIPHDIVKN